MPHFYYRVLFRCPKPKTMLAFAHEWSQHFQTNIYSLTNFNKFAIFLSNDRPLEIEETLNYFDISLGNNLLISKSSFWLISLYINRVICSCLLRLVFSIFTLRSGDVRHWEGCGVHDWDKEITLPKMEWKV